MSSRKVHMFSLMESASLEYIFLSHQIAELWFQQETNAFAQIHNVWELLENGMWP